jgi:hypothetical protein
MIKIEIIVYVCMFVVLYHNWTDFPTLGHNHEVAGPLIRIGN